MPTTGRRAYRAGPSTEELTHWVLRMHVVVVELRQGIVEVRVDDDFVVSRHAPFRSLIDRGQPRDRFARLGDRDLLAGLDSLQKAREVRLRLVDIDLGTHRQN